MSKAKDRPTTGTDGKPLPILPPVRDPRVWARMVRVMLFTPGFLAVLLIKAGEPTNFGVTVELLMLASASAVVAGLFIGSESEGAGADHSSRVGAWSGALVLEFLAAVPLLTAVPGLFHELATSALLHKKDAEAVVSLGASELLPLMAIIPFMIYQLAGFGTLRFTVAKSVNWLVNLVILGLVLGSYTAYRLGDFVTERMLVGLMVLGLVAVVVYGILKLRQMQEDYDRRCPHTDPAKDEK